MRLLFVSATTVGGSGRSQRELANRLRELGHSATFLVDDARSATITRWCYGHLSDASARFERRWIGPLLRRVERLPGRRTRTIDLEGLQHICSPVIENAAASAIDETAPDVVIGNSVSRLSWRKIRRLCSDRAIPTVLYIREVETLNHFDERVMPSTAIVANAESLAATIRGYGLPCSVFPSVIETQVTAVDSSRECALVINPSKSRGIDIVWKIAAALPEIRIVVQESWPLEADEILSVQKQVDNLPNVTFRRAEPPGPKLYADARVLLVPYQVDNRPRVIAEAQANGIPVIACNSPALVEATGAGGVVVDSDDIAGWCNALTEMCTDPALYASLSDSALVHSTRDEISASAVARRFETFLGEVVARGDS